MRTIILRFSVVEGGKLLEVAFRPDQTPVCGLYSPSEMSVHLKGKGNEIEPTEMEVFFWLDNWQELITPVLRI